ncbi:MAG: Holliday junction resolvase RuvX [Chloroflexota bacterium]
MRILAVDPGEKRIGLAISDPTGTIANPLTVIQHTSRAIDAASIASIAAEWEAERIIIGAVYSNEGGATPQSRHAARLAEAIGSQANIPVELWDESGSTQAARAASIAMGIPARKRRRSHGHLDDIAATYILQTYLDFGRKA